MPNDTPLHKACHNGEIETVKKLIEGGEYDVNERAWWDVDSVDRTIQMIGILTHARTTHINQPARGTGARYTGRQGATTSTSAAT
jgi:hypothetical protein